MRDCFFLRHKTAIVCNILFSFLLLGGLPLLSQSRNFHRDSTTTVTPEGDTIISFIPRFIDFGDPILPSERGDKKLVYTEIEKEDAFEAYSHFHL